MKRKNNTQMRSLKNCTLDTRGVRVLCLYLLRRLNYALLCCYWFCTLLFFSTRLRALQYITLPKQFRPHPQHQQPLEEAVLLPFNIRCVS
jgi:hypothetical protein